ncbi:MAG: hypothetical protein K2J80_08220 [Oscillospiraceae bacterium]|nr:hypothetical protein [Oscillospiraceae bacterium]
MSITVNDGGVLRTLGEISVNDGGVLKKLSTVHANTGEVMRQIFSAGTPISDVNVGDIVKMRLSSGGSYNFIVVHKGKPSSIYDDSCDGIWILKETAWKTDTWFDEGGNNYFPNSNIRYSADQLYSKIDPAVRPAIKSIKIPYYKAKTEAGGGGGTVQSGSNGYPCRGFSLSGIEAHANAAIQDGASLPYFNSNAKRICYYGGEAVKWWTRSPNLNSSPKETVVLVGKDGGGLVGNGGFMNQYNLFYVRPAFILSYSAKVDKNNYIVA